MLPWRRIKAKIEDFLAPESVSIDSQSIVTPYKLKHGCLVDTFIEEATQKRPREHRMCIKQKKTFPREAFCATIDT